MLAKLLYTGEMSGMKPCKCGNLDINMLLSWIKHD